MGRDDDVYVSPMISTQEHGRRLLTTERSRSPELEGPHCPPLWNSCYCSSQRDKPERRSVHAALLFKEAMQKAWPCK
jgi:hypothetical protein